MIKMQENNFGNKVEIILFLSYNIKQKIHIYNFFPKTYKIYKKSLEKVYITVYNKNRWINEFIAKHVVIKMS